MQQTLDLAELELIDAPDVSTTIGSNACRPSVAVNAADTQKLRAHTSLLAAAQSEHERLIAVQAERDTEFINTLSTEERADLHQSHARLRILHAARDAAASDAAMAESVAAGLRSQLDEHLRKRQEELQLTISSLAPEHGADCDARQNLADARAKLAASGQALANATDERAAKLDLERALQTTTDGLNTRVATERALHVEVTKQVDEILSRRSILQQKAEEFATCIRRLGGIPKDALNGVHDGTSSTMLLAQIDECYRAIATLGHVRVVQCTLAPCCGAVSFRFIPLQP